MSTMQWVLLGAMSAAGCSERAPSEAQSLAQGGKAGAAADCEALRPGMRELGKQWLGSRPDIPTSRHREIQEVQAQIEEVFVRRCRTDQWSATLTACLAAARTEGQSQACGETPNSAAVSAEVRPLVQQLSKLAPPPFVGPDVHGADKTPSTPTAPQALPPASASTSAPPAPAPASPSRAAPPAPPNAGTAPASPQLAPTTGAAATGGPR